MYAHLYVISDIQSSTFGSIKVISEFDLLSADTLVEEMMEVSSNKITMWVFSDFISVGTRRVI